MHPELAKLDRQLQAKGEDVILKRKIGTTDTYASVTCRALVRGNKTEDMLGPYASQVHDVIMSPSAIANANPSTWPGDAGGDVWPLRSDNLVIKSQTYEVKSVGEIAIGDEMIRLELTVAG